jgi:hypothetical protein
MPPVILSADVPSVKQETYGAIKENIYLAANNAL